MQNRTSHPTPWKVAYNPKFIDAWSEKAEPFIIDANRECVCRMNQYVDHPGLYDERADEVAQLIVAAVNSFVCK